eukprot:gene16822-43020_t
MAAEGKAPAPASGLTAAVAAPVAEAGAALRAAAGTEEALSAATLVAQLLRNGLWRHAAGRRLLRLCGFQHAVLPAALPAAAVAAALDAAERLRLDLRQQLREERVAARHAQLFGVEKRLAQLKRQQQEVDRA